MRPLVFILAAVSVSVPRVWGEAFPQVDGRWFAATGKPAAVALVIEGLNLKPQKMDALSRAFAHAGIDVFRLALWGQEQGAFESVSAAMWLSQTRDAYRQVSERARRLDVPVYFLGFSLGGLLGEVLLNTATGSEPVRFDRVVLLAPAIALRPFAYLVKPLFLLGKSFTLPSADNPEYRSHRGTPMAAYEALFKLIRLLRGSRYRAANVPTLLFIRSDDELVSPRGLRAIIRDYHLSNWSLAVLPDNGPRGYPHHLIIDPETLGRVEWERMKAAMLQFLLDAPGAARGSGTVTGSSWYTGRPNADRSSEAREDTAGYEGRQK